MNLEDLYRLLRSEHVQAQGIVDTLDEPLLVLDQAGCVLTANRGFYQTFRVGRDDTVGRSLFALGDGQWDLPELRRLVGEIIPRSAAIVGYEVAGEFPTIGRRKSTRPCGMHSMSEKYGGLNSSSRFSAAC
jgi:PAS domain-containing protein